jgi:hypothetical protein
LPNNGKPQKAQCAIGRFGVIPTHKKSEIRQYLWNAVLELRLLINLQKQTQKNSFKRKNLLF